MKLLPRPRYHNNHILPNRKAYLHFIALHLAAGKCKRYGGNSFYFVPAEGAKKKNRQFFELVRFGFSKMFALLLCSGKTLKPEVIDFGFFSYFLAPPVETLSQVETSMLLVL